MTNKNNQEGETNIITSIIHSGKVLLKCHEIWTAKQPYTELGIA